MEGALPVGSFPSVGVMSICRLRQAGRAEFASWQHVARFAKYLLEFPPGTLKSPNWKSPCGYGLDYRQRYRNLPYIILVS